MPQDVLGGPVLVDDRAQVSPLFKKGKELADRPFLLQPLLCQG